jgi:pimeloyl-ACP methyl ester carboxylesterase
MLRLSNFSGQGLAPVGRYQGLGPFGTLDMAGNVKEWTSTAAEVGRYIPGGAWNEPTYMFMDFDSQDPFSRLTTHGFRCVRYTAALPSDLTAPAARIIPDMSRRKPVDDQLFEVFRRLYAYDRTPLEPRVDEVEESEYWRRERVSYAAAYGGERIPALVFIPKSAGPPYQAVVYFPPGSALLRATSADVTSEMRLLDFVPRSGRVLIYPVYKGTYERRVEVKGPSDYRDLVVQRSKDFGRTLDYLAARGDIDTDRVAYYGFSMGADAGPILTAVDPRVKANVFVGGGLTFGDRPPEIDLVNFLPRVHIPTLMINGRDDYLDPLETSQKPMFQLLGVPPEHKRHAVFPTGHVAPRTDVIRESLDWFDRYLGPVRTR